MNRKLGIAACVLLAASSVLRADDKLTLAKELTSLERESYEATISNIVGMASALTGMMGANRDANAPTPELPDFSQLLSWQKIEPIMSKVLADVYSEEELKGSLDLLKSPVGLKMRKLQNQLVNEMTTGSMAALVDDVLGEDAPGAATRNKDQQAVKPNWMAKMQALKSLQSNDMPLNEALESIAKTFAEDISDADVSALRTFYTSPIGAAVRAKTAAVEAKTQQAMMDLMTRGLLSAPGMNPGPPSP